MSPYPWFAEAWKHLLARRENLPQALLLHGPRGVGKLDLARHFAQRILCETPNTVEACGNCEGCRWFLAGQHPDFRQVEPEALAAPAEPVEGEPSTSRSAKPSHEIKVDQIRELADFLNIGSHRGRRRITLIHPAEAMNANAANSLLKSLEDPASGVCFILISNNRMHLLPTVRSRCISVAVAIPDRAQGLAWLRQEKVEDADAWLAFAGGAPLLARELAESGRGELVSQLTDLLQREGKRGLLRWSATDRERIEALSEVLQKWAYDKAFGEYAVRGGFFATSGARTALDSSRRRAWVRFALEAGRYRTAARHPLNPQLFAEDLISQIPD